MKVTFSDHKTYNIEDNASLDAIDKQLLSSEETDLIDFMGKWYGKAVSFKFQTSGSTGAPATVILTRNQLHYSANQTLESLNLHCKSTSKPRLLLCISPKFIGGVMVFVRAYLLDAHLLVLPPTTDFDSIDSPIDLCSLVPLQVEKLCEKYTSKIHLFKQVLIGGAPISQSLERKTIKQLTSYQKWYATYGMTETASHVALRILGTPLFKSIGDVVFSQDDRGCLMIKGTITQHQPLVTNDLIQLIDDSTFEWRGRFDFIINSGGIKINPEKIEAILSEQMKNNDLLVTWIPDSKLGQKLVCLYSGSLLKDSSQLKLQSYEFPKLFFQVDHLPKNKNQKIDRMKAHEWAKALSQKLN